MIVLEANLVQPAPQVLSTQVEQTPTALSVPAVSNLILFMSNPRPSNVSNQSSWLALGYYCPDTVTPVICSSGDFSYAGSTSSSDCETCPAGYSCPSMSAIPEACPEGYYAASGDAVCRKCRAGYYCPTPTTETAVSGLNYALEGATYYKIVPVGYKMISTSMEPLLCSAGTFW
jgi:hypothetical protein